MADKAYGVGVSVLDKWIGRFIKKTEDEKPSLEEDAITREMGAFGTTLKEDDGPAKTIVDVAQQEPTLDPLEESMMKARQRLTFDERGKRYALSVAFEGLLESLDAGGRSKAAETLLSEALLVCNDATLRKRLAERLIHRGDRNGARTLLEQLKNDEAHAAFAYMALGEIEDAAGDHERAMAAYESVLAIDMTQQQAKVRARRLREKRDDWNRKSHDKRAQLTRFLGAKAAGSRYAVLEEIGRGGAATVFRAQDRLVSREVALKIYHPRGREEERRARLVHEARVAGRFDHPHIVPILDVDPERDLLVMAICNGGSLRERLKKGRLGTRAATEWGTVLLRTLGDIHEVEQMHLDIKPSNLLFHDERLLVGDFGTAGLRELGAAAGTRAYMAPEHRDFGQTSQKCDLFSAGLVIFESLEGHLPQDIENPTLESVSGPKKRALEFTLKRLLDPDPNTRASDARMLAEDLLLAASLPLSDAEGWHLLEHLHTIARSERAQERLNAHPISIFLRA